MDLDKKIVTIFGGTGFLGRQIVRLLAARGYRVKVATRVPERAYFLKTAGTPGQVVPLACNYADESSVRGIIQGSDFVINCIGILFERGKGGRFAVAHIDIPARIARACAQSGVKAMVHVSALGVDKSASQYARTKLEGEKAVRENFPRAVILRPSVIFGEDDNFFNMFAELARYVPVLPLIGGGKTKFQPVYVGDVAEAALKVLDHPQAAGYTLELGGPETLSLKEVYERLFIHTGRRRMTLNMPFALAKVQAAFMNLLPTPLLTPDQVESLKTDNVVTPGMPGFAELGMTPRALDSVLPLYLARYRKGGRFADIKAV